MVALDVQTVTAIGAASAGLTQILKDFGVAGQWNKLVCVAISVALGCIYMFDQPLWLALVLPLIGTTATGGISKLHELADMIGSSSGQ